MTQSVTVGPGVLRTLRTTDPEVAEAVANEIHRQNTGLELIASENFVSRAVLEAMGSVMTNKYAEGYPGRRYYGGCEYVDVAEALAISRAKALFHRAIRGDGLGSDRGRRAKRGREYDGTTITSALSKPAGACDRGVGVFLCRPVPGRRPRRTPRSPRAPRLRVETVTVRSTIAGECLSFLGGPLRLCDSLC